MFKYDKNFTYVCAILAILIGAFTYIYNYQYMVRGKPANVNKMLYMNNYELESEELKKEGFVSLTIDSSLGSFATEKHKWNGITTGEDTYYIAFLEDNSVIAVKLHKQSDIDLIEKITGETFASKDYVADSTLTIEGAVTSLPYEVDNYYNDALTQLGINGQQNNKIMMRHVCIDASVNRKSMWLFVSLMIGCGFFTIFGQFIISLVKDGIKNAKQRKVEIQQNMILEQREKDEKARRSVYTEETDYDSALGKGTVMDPDKKGDELPEYEEFNMPEEEEPRFGTPDRFERTADGKVAITGRNLIK